MTAEIQGNQTFRPRKNFKTILLPLIILPIFVIVGLVLLVSMPGAGVFMIAFFGLLWIVMFAQGAGWWSVYRIRSDGLFVQRWWQRRLYRFEEIEEVNNLSADQVRDRLQPYLEKEAEGVRNVDFGTAMSGRWKQSDYTRFCTVPITFTQTTKGSPINIVDIGSKTRGEFIEIQVSNGKRYLLSPLDNQGFASLLRTRSAPS